MGRQMARIPGQLQYLGDPRAQVGRFFQGTFSNTATWLALSVAGTCAFVRKDPRTRSVVAMTGVLRCPWHLSTVPCTARL